MGPLIPDPHSTDPLRMVDYSVWSFSSTFRNHLCRYYFSSTTPCLAACLRRKSGPVMAHQQKGLRVSGIPEGSQRSYYFLSLPYRVGVPLVALSSLASLAGLSSHVRHCH